MSTRPTDVSALLNGIHQKALVFQDVIDFIESNYHYTPVSFTNGEIHNNAGENEGSAKIFGFAQLNKLNQVDTLKLFCEHYQSVLDNPNAHDHANIRNFRFWGWEGFLMQKNPLTPKT